jgi:hypothetical protein
MSFSCWRPLQVKYVRRAVELADGLNIPGLSSECVQYVAMHPSNAYDVQVMEIFARGLFAAGHRDNAGTVYASLLNVSAHGAHFMPIRRQCNKLRERRFFAVLSSFQGGEGATALVHWSSK